MSDEASPNALKSEVTETQQSASEKKPKGGAKEDSSKRPHTAVIYFHGMGNQRRFEETARLVDRVETYLDKDRRAGGVKGTLEDIAARAEPSMSEDDDVVSYIAARQSIDEGTKNISYKFYEAYWADETAQKRPVRGVLTWVLRQIGRPIGTLWTPWRERQRLRRSILIGMLTKKIETVKARYNITESLDEVEAGQMRFDRGQEILEQEGPYRKLLDAYVSFDGRLTESGWFSEFLAHIREHYSDDGPDALVALARKWKRRYVLTEVRNFVAMLSILLALAVITFSFAQVALFALAAVPNLLTGAGLGNLNDQLPDWAQPNMRNAVTLGFGALLFLGLKGFLVDRLADVEAWSAYKETDERYARRKAVLDRCVGLLSHVFSRPGCERVVIVGHSLGTSVAYDSILSAVHVNRATNPQAPTFGQIDFSKLSHFVTLGSPIDKIAYFFESFRTRERRYRKIYNEFRGDIGTAPFTRAAGQLKVHWINVWDRLDIISGSVESPAPDTIHENRKALPLIMVDNVHVNNMAYMNPGAAHNAYFDNAKAVEILSEVILDNRGAYDTHNLKFMKDQGNKRGQDYNGADFGPGVGQSTWTKSLAVAIAVPFFAFASIVVGWLGHDTAEFWLWIITAALLIYPAWTILLTFLRWVFSGFRKQSRLADPL